MILKIAYVSMKDFSNLSTESEEKLSHYSIGICKAFVDMENPTRISLLP